VGCHHRFLDAGTGLLVPFCKQCRVFLLQVQDCRKAEKNKPDTEDPAFRPGEISGKEDDECWKYQNVQEGEGDLLLHAYCIGSQRYDEPCPLREHNEVVFWQASPTFKK